MQPKNANQSMTEFVLPFWNVQLLWPVAVPFAVSVSIITAKTAQTPLHYLQAIILS